MPPKDVQDDLVTRYFRDVNWHYCTIERVYFDDLHTQWLAVDTSHSSSVDFKGLSRELQFFPALLFQLFGLTLQFVRIGDGFEKTPVTVMARTESTCEDLSYKYSDIGTDLLSLLGRHRTDIVSIQAYITRASVLKNYGHGVEAWYVIGDAIRQAQELEFHRQSEISQTGADDIECTLRKFWAGEYKRRLFSILFCWDRYV